MGGTGVLHRSPEKTLRALSPLLCMGYGKSPS